MRRTNRIARSPRALRRTIAPAIGAAVALLGMGGTPAEAGGLHHKKERVLIVPAAPTRAVVVQPAQTVTRSVERYRIIERVYETQAVSPAPSRSVEAPREAVPPGKAAEEAAGRSLGAGRAGGGPGAGPGGRAGDPRGRAGGDRHGRPRADHLSLRRAGGDGEGHVREVPAPGTRVMVIREQPTYVVVPQTSSRLHHWWKKH